MKRKQGVQIIKGSLSPQQPKQSGLYMGKKIRKSNKNYSVYGGATYTKRNTGGCGCGGKVAKQTGSQAEKQI